MADKPIPTNEGEFELFIENLAAKIGPFVTDLGLSVGDTTRLGDSATTFDYLRNMANQVNDSKDEFFSFKDQMFHGPTEGTVKVPVFPVLDMPEGATPGIITWTRQLVKTHQGRSRLHAADRRNAWPGDQRRRSHFTERHHPRNVA